VFTISNEEEAKSAYAKLKFGAMSFCIFKRISDATFTMETAQSKLDKENDDSDILQRILQHLPKDDCRYVLMNLDYISETDGVKRSKMIMINWIPEIATAKSKMLSAVYLKSLGRKLESWGGNNVFALVEASDPDGLDRKDVEKKITSKCTVK